MYSPPPERGDIAGKILFEVNERNFGASQSSTREDLQRYKVIIPILLKQDLKYIITQCSYCLLSVCHLVKVQ